MIQATARTKLSDLCLRSLTALLADDEYLLLRRLRLATGAHRSA